MISIIVPVYKAESFLDRCVQSILSQTYSDLEVLLVDDGSPDGSGAICDAYAQQDPRVRVIHKENGGVCSARNAGLDAARGEYIAFVDSDDYIDVCMYQRMMEKVWEYNCDVVMCDCLKEYPDYADLYTHAIRPGHYDRNQLEIEYFPHLLMMENVEYPATISNCLLLFRRERAEGLRYLSGVRYSEDLLFGAQLMYRARSFYYMKEQAYYHYVMNPQSASHRFVSDKWSDYQKLHWGIQTAFESCEDFNFSRQIDLCLLFFTYNAVGDIYGSTLSGPEKKEKILGILNTFAVREMMKRLPVWQLPVSVKQKAITTMYRYRIGISLLVRYYKG